MKKPICLLLTVLIALTLTGCFRIGDYQGGTLFPTQPPAQTDNSEKPADQSESASQAPAVTAVPAQTVSPAQAASADEAFRELDLEIFRDYVTSSTDTYNQFIVSDPGKFGIDPADVNPGWGELSLEAHNESMNYAREMLQKLQAIDRGALNESNQYAYDYIKRHFETDLMYEDYYYYDEPLEPLNGFHTMLPLAMICFSIRNLDDVENYLCLVEDMERIISQIEQFEVEKAGEGLFMCEKALDQVTESCRNFARKGEKSFLITYFDEVIDKAKEFGATSAQCDEFKARNRASVLEHVLPAYAHLADTLEAHRADCSPYTGAVQRGEKAKAYFELSAKDEGATMEDTKDVIDLLQKMGEGTYYDMCMAVLNGGDEVLEEYGEPITMGSVEKNLEWLRAFVKQYYPEMPDYSLKYVDVPADIADDFSPAAYLIPAFDDHYDNLMLINRSSEGSDELLTIAHETIPGHMYQYLSARNDPDLSLAQQVFEETGYAEAWTVFSEKFVASKCFDIGPNYCPMMNCESTFCNIFLPAYISFRVNVDGWTEAQTAEYLSVYGIEDSADIFYEYAVTMPTYAMSYAVGYAYLYDIHKTAAPDSPAQYKAFFEKYLSFGPSYMDEIRSRMK